MVVSNAICRDSVVVPLTVNPLVVKVVNVPTLVKLLDTTLLARVVPVNVPAGALGADPVHAVVC